MRLLAPLGLLVFLSLNRCAGHSAPWQDLSREVIACYVVEDAPSDVAYNPKALHVMRGDGSERVEIGHGQHADWSPDGRTLVVVSSAFDGLYLLGIQDRVSAALVSYGCCLGHPSWSPDGERIAFLRDEELWVTASDGSGAQQLTDHGRRATVDPPSWSPDGDRLVFSVYSYPRSGTEGHSELWVMNADGSGATELSGESRYWYDPVWSPKEDRIAFNSCGDAQCEILVMNADGSDLEYLGNGILYDWSPDGSRLYFRLLHDDFLWTMNSDGSGRTRLFELNCEDPTWSPVLVEEEANE